MTSASASRACPAPVFEVPRQLLLLYAAIAAALSVALVGLAVRRGTVELAWWVAVCVALAGVAWRWPSHGPLVAGWAAFVLGFARTWRHGPNLDLGLALILLALAIYLLRAPACRKARLTLDCGAPLLAGVAVFALVSLVFTVVRIRSFAPAPGFGYHVYRLNALGLSSEEAFVRVGLNAAVTFAWFGAYVFGRTARVPRRALAFAILSALLLNSAALLAQTYAWPDFLHPAGWAFYDRWNGVTSFCWALGDAALVFFLLLPLWGAWRGRDGLITGAALLLLAHGVMASGSRTALGAMLAATLLWATTRIVRGLAAGRREPALALAGAILLLVGGLLVAYHVTPPDNSTPIGRLKEGFERQGFLGHLVAVRLGSYPLALRVSAGYPLSGIGAGLYPVEVEKYRALLLPHTESLDPFLVSSFAPNQLLNLAAELGLPAALSLLATFLIAIGRALRSRSALGFDLGVSSLVLLGALQIGPGLYNSEALLFAFLIVGSAAAVANGSQSAAAWLGEPGAATAAPARRFGSRSTLLVLAAALVLALGGQLLAHRSLSVDQQWRRLRWRMNIGLQPPQDGGQWTAAEATFSTDAATPGVLLRWHAGDRAATRYAASVSFFVDGVHVATIPAQAGVVRETRLPLPEAKGFKRISVRVAPPFVPARELGGSDERRLGIFVHAIVPVP